MGTREFGGLWRRRSAFLGVDRSRSDCLQRRPATQAGTYHGANGIAIGFADAVGTLEDAHAALVAHLQDRSMSTLRGTAALHSSPEEESMGDKKTPEVPAEEQAQSAAGDAPAVQEEKKTELVDFEKEQAKAAGKLEERAYAKEVRQLCALAGKPELADDFIDAETSVDVVRQTLVDGRVEGEQAEEISGQHEGRAGSGDRAPVDMAAVQSDAFERYRAASQ